MTREKIQACDIARRIDHRLHHYGPLDSRASGQWRINWLDLTDDERLSGSSTRSEVHGEEGSKVPPAMQDGANDPPAGGPPDKRPYPRRRRPQTYLTPS
jgi:hypothetical protein